MTRLIALGLTALLGAGIADAQGGPLSPVREGADSAGASDSTLPAFLLGPRPGRKALEPLPPEIAFVLEVVAAGPDALTVRFDVDDCCYLYRDKLRFALIAPGPASQRLPRLGRVDLPPGETTEDPYFGTTATYRGRLDLRLSLHGIVPASNFALEITYQGCSEKGVAICYPPVIRRVPVRVENGRLVVSPSA